MKTFSRIGIFVAAALMLGLAAVTPAFAAGISVDPTYGNYDTSFDVQASGFAKNERVAVWLGLSNGSTVNLGETKANGSGAIEVSVSPESSWPQGEVIFAAQGLNSKVQVTTKFNILGEPQDNSGTAASDAPAVVNNLTVTYWAAGYTPGERVATWFQYPNEAGTSVAHALPDVFADAQGEVRFNFSVQKDWMFGSYHITAQGSESKHVTFNTFAYFNQVSVPYTYTANAVTNADGLWYAQYYNNPTLSGSPVLVRTDSAVNFNWGTGSPDSVVPADNFSARWTMTRYFNAGDYTVTARSDDGIRVWVDGSLVIDQWFDHSATTYTAGVSLGAGNHTVNVEYYERTLDAVAQVSIN